ncbi:hypothetical protein [uncultured Deefgea sp.]|uniref:hypothetical protein n=1 Tax=uncultured Deefgea sp. TaxID=1304914 RepID=UPI0026316982|nr:hypothetical protein [uncultured Deefgea sp.]
MQTLNQILAAIGLQILNTPTGVTRNHLCDAQIHIMAAMEPCAIEHFGVEAGVAFGEQIQTIILEAVDSNGEMTLNQIYELIEGMSVAAGLPKAYLRNQVKLQVFSLVNIGSLVLPKGGAESENVYRLPLQNAENLILEK